MTLAIHQLVRRLRPDEYDPKRDDHFIYDPAKGAFERTTSIFGAKRRHHYAVVCSTTGTADAKGSLGKVGVTDPDTGSVVEIEVWFEAMVLPSNAQTLIRMVASDDPGAHLARLVVQAVQGAALANLDALPQEASRVAREVERHLLRELGLSIVLRLHLDDGVSALPEFEVEAAIQLADYGEELRLRLGIAATLRDRDRRQSSDAMHRNPHLKEALVVACRAVFRNVGLQTFKGELHGRLKNELRGQLEQELRKWYFGLQNLRIEPVDRGPEPDRFVEVVASFGLPVRGYPSPVHLETRVQLEIEDEALYHRAGRPNLQSWLSEQATIVIRQVLFDVRYSQLCLNVELWEARILQQLKSVAASIGYRVRAQVTTPDVPELELMSPFGVEISEEFVTAVEFVSTRLDIVLSLKLESLDKVTHEMDRGVDLRALFHAAALQEARLYLHTLEPGFLFTRFADPKDHTGRVIREDAAEGDTRPSVERVLIDRIRAALQRFGVELLSLTVKQGPSQIREQFLSLIQAVTIPFQVQVSVLGHATPVTYHGAVQVQGVVANGWAKFQNVLPTREDVAGSAERAVLTLLRDGPASLGPGFSPAELDRIVEQQLPPRLADSLGLHVTREAWYPDPSATNVLFAEARTAAIAARLQWEHQEQQRALEELSAIERELSKARRLGEKPKMQQLEARRAELKAQNGGVGATRAPGPGMDPKLPAAEPDPPKAAGPEPTSGVEHDGQ